MEREILSKLTAWKDSPRRKPLVLLGARQVGKTWILREFGKRFYKTTAYINCDNNPDIDALFADYDMERIIMTISAITHVSVRPGETLIILDEIQQAKNGLAALKYFRENASDYHVAVAGSLPGIQLHENESFPVGQVDSLQMRPMSFPEFLQAKGEDGLLSVLRSANWPAIAGLKHRFIQNLREYYFVGGMPEAVADFVANKDPNSVRRIQREILLAYERDVSKHAPTAETVRINQVWRSIPSQLAKENRKFIYGAIKQGARAKDFEIAIQWLINAGLVYRIPRAKLAALPLANFEDFASFKLYLLDCGLLGALNNTPAVSLLLPGGLAQGNGSFTENYVCSVLAGLSDATLAFFSKDDSTLEIDFLLQLADMVIPIEVKAEENLKAKSLSTFLADRPELHGLRFSMSDYREQERFTNVPLYAAAVYLQAAQTSRDAQIAQLLAARSS